MELFSLEKYHIMIIEKEKGVETSAKSADKKRLYSIRYGGE